ncbi:hypothetical protein [Mariniflexile sp.]|uniref:hypothetical protein n=1 Tax=Mariniflexile sp. TaxID=1979402 RepID=UPI0035631A2D
MKKQLSLFSMLVVFSLLTFAQQRVALHSNGTTTIFSSETPLIEAYNAAITGDTLYVSGGSFVMPTLNKGLVIIGAGFYPEYTEATLPTVITNDFYIREDADNLYLEGLQIQNLFKYRNVNTDNFTLIRCMILGRIDSSVYTSSGSVNSVNASIIQCLVTGDINMYGFVNSNIINSILDNRITGSNSNVILNNIFLYSFVGNNAPLYDSDNNTVENNIFHTSGYITYNSVGNIFRNNIFTQAAPNLGGASYDFNNYKGIDLATVHINQSGNAFSYTDNYKLQENAKTTYLGTDSPATQVGIYGGISPYKDGALPVNPHISAKSISNSTDNNGYLNIEFTVNAQQN